ncbi:hypothetical protein RCJ22_10770, partial [Vibrio sp. FNV 38]|nr:hypothetical protein [Vibrio sp. FNV 38]
CGVCGKYYLTADGSDEGRTAAPLLHDENAHKFGEMIRERSAACTEAGVKAHKTCEYCGGDFDADGGKLNTLAIPALGHDLGEWIEEVPAGCTVPGARGHYTCGRCGEDFDAEENRIDDLTIPAAHRLTHVPYKA